MLEDSKSKASDNTAEKLTDVYKSLFGEFFPSKDNVENQSFLAVTVKYAKSLYPNSADPNAEFIFF